MSHSHSPAATYYTYKGKSYRVVSWNAMIQVDDVWVSAVIYTNDSGILFTRTHTEFTSKFKEQL